MLNTVQNLEKKIGIKFLSKKILIKSLTHKSFSSQNNNEKLEFLGDRVLGLIISKKLLELYPNDTEGVLDKKLSSLVNKKICCKVGKKINLHDFIILGNSKNKKNQIVDKIISDTCEALIGAIYVDQGFSVAEKFISNHWMSFLNKSDYPTVDSKTKLQEYSLKQYKILPIYKLMSNTGPRHKPIFKVGVKVNNSKFIFANGNSKKNAEQKAAFLFLKKMDI